MYSVTGKVLKIFKSPEGHNSKTGEAFGGESKIQIMGENFLRNGEIQMEMITLTLPEKWGEPAKTWVGKDMVFHVGLFVAGKHIKPYLSENSKMPETKAVQR